MNSSTTVEVGGMYLDDLNQLKVFKVEQQSHTQDLQNACNAYTQKVERFNSTSQEFDKQTKIQADRVEKSRLAAVGLNCITNQVDTLANADKAVLESRVKELTGMVRFC